MFEKLKKVLGVNPNESNPGLNAVVGPFPTIKNARPVSSVESAHTIQWGNLPEQPKHLTGSPRAEIAATDEAEVEFDFQAFHEKLDSVAAAASERALNKPWSDDCDYDYL